MNIPTEQVSDGPSHIPTRSLSHTTSLKHTKVAVVGADEYLGQLVVKQYLDNGAQVVAFLPEKAEWSTMMELTDKGAKVCPGSIDTVQANMDGVDVVVCCLGVRYSALIANIEIYWDDHRVALQRVFDIACESGVRRLILVGTMEGVATQRWLSLSKAKEMAIQQIKQRSNQHEIKFTIIRSGLLFRDITSILPSLQNSILGRGKLNLRRTQCMAQTNPIHEADLAHFIVECTNDGRYYNCEVGVGGPEVIYSQELYCKMLAARDPHHVQEQSLKGRHARTSKQLNRWMKYIFEQDLVGIKYGQRSLEETLRGMEMREMFGKESLSKNSGDIFSMFQKTSQKSSEGQ